MTAVFLAIEIIGIISFAISGAIEAINKETDMFGVVFLAITTSFGGGIIRDLIIGNTVPLFFTSYLLVGICIVTALIVFALASLFKSKFVENEKLIAKINNVFDALALGAFAVSGAKITMDFGRTEFFVATVMGMITCVGGSMIRDFCLREIPFILRKRVYALAALTGGACYWVMMRLEVNEIISMIVSALLVFIIRMLATVFSWNMPKAIDFSKLKNDKITEDDPNG